MLHVTFEAVWDVLKWVLLVLAAGFIGQFGKSFALKLIERRRRHKTGSDSASSPYPLPAEIETPRLEAQTKIEKKRVKAKLKWAKKAGTGPSGNDSRRSPDSGAV
jgi:hypothetical protein